jgi:hypothetical protein
MPFPKTEIDATIDQMTTQGFADGQAILRKQAIRSEAGNELVTELVRASGQTTNKLIDVSAGQTQTLITTKAADAILNGGLAMNILGQRSAGGQPQASAVDAGVNAGGK